MRLLDMLHFFKDVNRSRSVSSDLLEDTKMEIGTDVSYEDIPPVSSQLLSALDKRPWFRPRQLADSYPFTSSIYGGEGEGNMPREKGCDVHMNFEIRPLERPEQVDVSCGNSTDTRKEARRFTGAQEVKEFVDLRIKVRLKEQ
ncbi:hypothetical protein MMC14_002164 [Varicellaria rhodocarpa]|nr:hypothetical protein [Varicellaria rhodocarpa]